MVKKFVAYSGVKFTIEWYFDCRGKSSALKYFEDLSFDQRKKFIYLLYLLGDIGKIFNKEKFRYEGNQIYAIKTSQNRFLCFFFDGSKIVVTNAYKKKTNKIPQREKSMALRAKKDYEKRYTGGIYYD